VSVITYPDRLEAYVLSEFARIKALQARLLGFKPPAPAPTRGEQQQPLSPCSKL
jgi:hypothetical protein